MIFLSSCKIWKFFLTFLSYISPSWNLVCRVRVSLPFHSFISSTKCHASALCAHFFVPAGCYACHMRSFLCIGSVTHLAFALTSFWYLLNDYPSAVFPTCCCWLVPCGQWLLHIICFRNRPNVAFCPVHPLLLSFCYVVSSAWPVLLGVG